MRQGVLSGAALLAPGSGECVYAAGCLAGEFARGRGGAATAEQFLRPFLEPDAEVVALELRGVRHVVVRRDARSLDAVAPRRAAGLAVHALPCGTLVAAYDRPSCPRSVAGALEAACQALR